MSVTVELTILLERGEDGFWIATIPEISGAFSQGMSRRQAKQNVVKAMVELMEARRSLATKTRSENGIIEKLPFNLDFRESVS